MFFKCLSRGATKSGGRIRVVPEAEPGTEPEPGAESESQPEPGEEPAPENESGPDLSEADLTPPPEPAPADDTGDDDPNNERLCGVCARVFGLFDGPGGVDVLYDAPANSNVSTGCVCTVEQFSRCVPCCLDMHNAGVEYCPTCNGYIAEWLLLRYGDESGDGSGDESIDETKYESGDESGDESIDVEYEPEDEYEDEPEDNESESEEDGDEPEDSESGSEEDGDEPEDNESEEYGDEPEDNESESEEDGDETEDESEDEYRLRSEKPREGHGGDAETLFAAALLASGLSMIVALSVTLLA